MTEALDSTVNLRVSKQSFDMANLFKELTGSTKSSVDRMAHVIGLEVMDEIRRSSNPDEFFKNVAARSVSLTKMRHYDEVKSSKDL